MLINSIHVESGSNVVLSNLKFDTKEIQSIDMMRLIKSNPSLSRVVGISTRFPYLQPAAKFEYPNGSTWGHLADGGYYENSGVFTLFQIYISLREIIKKMASKESLPKIRFNLLLLSNGEESKTSAPALFLNEINTPLSTLLNSWYTKGYSYSHIAKMTIKKIDPRDRFFEIKLDRKKRTIPLGWFLSGSSRDEIINQAENLNSNREYLEFTNHAF
ncbi:MAG: hypothetical protein PSX36_10660 [bacterium]|nr:hypothetical protein [bacterium]